MQGPHSQAKKRRSVVVGGCVPVALHVPLHWFEAELTTPVNSFAPWMTS